MSIATPLQIVSPKRVSVLDEDALKRELIELTSRLVSFRTVAGNYEELHACLHSIGEYLGKLAGVHFSRYENRDCPYLVVSTADTKHPDIILSGHIDVVPAAAEQFVPRLKGDRLYGRGALDMKGGVAAILTLFRDLADRRGGPSLALMLTSDEEQGSVGAHYLAQEHGWRTNFLLIPEGGEEMRFVAREKGSCWIKVTARGRAAHSAYPWRGENAAENLMTALVKLQTLVPPPADAWQSSISVSSLSAGERSARNQIPDYAEAILDVRYTPDFGSSGKEVIARFSQAAPDVAFELMANGDALAGSYTNNLLLRLQAITARRLGFTVPLGYNHGASDAAAFATFNIPAMTSGVVGAHHHGDHEYVSIKSLSDYYHIVREFILSWPGT